VCDDVEQSCAVTNLSSVQVGTAGEVTPGGSKLVSGLSWTLTSATEEHSKEQGNREFGTAGEVTPGGSKPGSRLSWTLERGGQAIDSATDGLLLARQLLDDRQPSEDEHGLGLQTSNCCSQPRVDAAEQRAFPTDRVSSARLWIMEREETAESSLEDGMADGSALFEVNGEGSVVKTRYSQGE